MHILIIMLIIFFLITIIIKQRKTIKYDNLTNLISYSYFIKKGEYILKKANAKEYTLVLVDIDDFKNLNKVLGVETANDILSMASNYLKEVMKKRGTTDYLLTRKSADQFLLLYKSSESIAKNIYSEYGRMFSKRIEEKLNIKMELRYSIGKVIIDDPRKNILIIIGEAHIANEQCKNHYNAHVEIFNDTKVNEVEKSILYAMNESLLENTMEIYFQPKYDLKSNKIIGAEALARWIEDGRVIYSPDEFIPVFEKYNFIQELDLYVFEQVCRTKKELGEKSKDNILISVNMSRKTLVKSNIIDTLIEIVDFYEISPHEIEIEITESALCVELDEMTQLVRELKLVGFHLSLDDFGTGQSSLANLNCFKIDTIKLDKRFLGDTIKKKDMRIMIKHIVQLLHEFELKVVAEGAETEDDVEVLKKFGCDIVQGYYFSKPVPKDMFYRLI